jgi:23S rRNA (guanine745-N1)-methyltransferase
VSGAPPFPPGAVALLACPVCGEGLTALPDDGGLRCASGHEFDRARQGHVTLRLPVRRPVVGDSAAMVADRAAFLGSGHYDGVTAALADAVLGDDGPRSLLDLGGGTGHHLAAILDRAPDAVGVVLDASAYAARRAARAHPRAMAVVADSWSRLPVLDAALDRVLVVFAPRNGPEIARVLRPGGRLVVVTPAADHLAELVGPLGLLRVDPRKAERTATTLEPCLGVVDATSRRQTLELDRAAVEVLVGMGPHARHLARDDLHARLEAFPEPVAVTVSIEIGVYEPLPSRDTRRASPAG